MTGERWIQTTPGPLLNTYALTNSVGTEVHNEIVTEGCFLSESNNSTTALGASATFTGTGELNGAVDVAVSCQTDQAGTLIRWWTRH